jgi:hypothetical protein
VQFHQELAAHEQWQARNALLRKATAKSGLAKIG